MLSFALLAAACQGSDGAPSTFPTVDPTATAVAPSPSAAPASRSTAPLTLAPDGERILDYVRELAEKIGSRPAGTAREKAAADYLAQQLRGFGYDVQLQEFPVSNDAGRDSLLAVRSSGLDTVPSVPFQGSAAGSVRGPLVAVPGAGAAADFPANARNAIVLIERGQLLFREKVANARAAGAAGVVIANNESGTFFGSLGESATLPTIAISQSEGQRLRSLLEKGPVTAEMSVDALSQSVSSNVIARPPSRDCETISGGHYDSVQQAAGANDNASGSATVLEIASILAANDRMSGNCFVLFGAEESGLIGSRAFVQSLDAAARGRLKAMLNFDMVGVGEDAWQLIGSSQLQERAVALAAALGMQAVRSSVAGTGSGSDHGSFIGAGIPALFLHRTNDAAWHTSGDVVDRIRPELLETAARFGLAMLDALNGGA